MNKVNILFLVGFISIFLMMSSPICIEKIKTNEIISCYDRYGNEMINEECYKYNYDMSRFGNILLFTSMSSAIIVFITLLFMEIKHDALSGKQDAEDNLCDHEKK